MVQALLHEGIYRGQKVIVCVLEELEISGQFIPHGYH
ncbi:hypothetical protein L914_17236 [Phytophthora nicotianae]|uniref:Uncharacterized protein n=1 Tax=Phytophthora nicotianae TaxID=4792 RepID=W2MI04_PHYNI|nr:hypothetical protein L914_17236 [Phytophthora nicotianae]